MDIRNGTQQTFELDSARLVLAASALLLTACGGGGGDDGGTNNVPPPPPPPPVVQDGVFKDRNVAGLAFSSGAESGVTDTNGGYSCETGSEVSFSIGGVSLGQTDCATLATPNQLATDDAMFDLEVANLARFLQMLDEDGDPDNGIVISDAVQQIAENWVQVDFRTDDLANELVTIISDAASVDGTLHALPSGQEALDHLQGAVECAFGGAFAGTMSGDLSGAITIRIGQAPPQSPFQPSNVGWDGVDGEEEFFIGGGGFGSVTYGASPAIDHSGPNLAGPLAGEFETPDRISGSWEFPPEGLGGTFTVDRMGDDTGEYRFVGRFGGEESRGSIVLGLTGETATGEAFDAVDAQSFSVSGTLSGDSLSLTATGDTETVTATATVGRDAQGAPVWLDGSFDDEPDSSFMTASACRLN